jgi:hypothetical protein
MVKNTRRSSPNYTTSAFVNLRKVLETIHTHNAERTKSPTAGVLNPDRPAERPLQKQPSPLGDYKICVTDQSRQDAALKFCVAHTLLCALLCVCVCCVCACVCVGGKLTRHETNHNAPIIVYIGAREPQAPVSYWDWGETIFSILSI